MKDFYIKFSTDSIINYFTNFTKPLLKLTKTLLILSYLASQLHTLQSLGGISVQYSPNANFNGADSFTYKFTEIFSGRESGIATVSIFVGAQNDAPVFTSSPITTAEAGKGYTYDANAIDPEGNVDVKNAVVSLGFYDYNANPQSNPRKILISANSKQYMTRRIYLEAPEEFVDGEEYYLRIISGNANTRGEAVGHIFFS